MSYKGKYKIKNAEKYMGDISKIRFLSLWELSVMKLLDNSHEVAKWNSEDVKINYVCATDGKQHKYLVDFFIIMTNGKRLLVEVKPKKQTIVPKIPKRKTRKYLTEQYYWIKNNSKWDAAREFAAINNAEFQIWTEDHLRRLGIKIL